MKKLIKEFAYPLYINEANIETYISPHLKTYKRFLFIGHFEEDEYDTNKIIWFL